MSVSPVSRRFARSVVSSTERTTERTCIDCYACYQAISVDADDDHLPSLVDDRVFSGADTLLKFATHHWREHFVTEDLVTREVIDAFSKRPFFLLINIEAPISTRFLRRNSCVLLRRRLYNQYSF